jgi:conjugative relaxase-like TrwC/TraI family protein
MGHSGFHVAWHSWAMEFTIPPRGSAAMMSTHKLTAGDGYLYLIRQTAAADDTKGRSALADYYSDKGESPGQWTGRGLAALSTPAGRELIGDTEHALWTVEAGAEVTEAQMKALFGLGMHPNAEAIVQHLVTVRGLARPPAMAAANLGRPFTINPGDTPLQRRLAQAYRDHNLTTGQHWNAPIAPEMRAQFRTALAREMFTEQYGRSPHDARELSGFLARQTRNRTTSVAGYDLTFTPVKSVSALWAIAPRGAAARIEDAHDRAVADALDFLHDHAAFTRIGAGGVAQIDTDGLMAAVFTHRDTRAGDPGLHSHVAVSNKVRAVGADGVPRWLALDGRPLFQATVAASELYNTRIEGYLGAALGVRFADRAGRERGKRPVREIVGVPAELTTLWSTRRAAIEARVAVLAKQFQTDHGREPTTVEAITLHQQATLETRSAKHEPRSLAEQRQAWRTQAIELLGSPAALTALLGAAMSGRRQTAAQIDADWVSQQARHVIDTVSQTRATWQGTHVWAEAQRRVRATGHATNPALAEAIMTAALADPVSLAVGRDRDADLGEPAVLRRRDGTSIYCTHQTQMFTSPTILAAERRILAAARRHDGRRIDPDDIDTALHTQAALHRELNAGQQHLVRELASCGTRVALALAPAGTGKTTAMSTLARAWQEGGGTVVGLAPSASAAEVLRREINVPATDTVAKYLWLHDNPDNPDAARDWFDTVGPDTLIVIDEAGKAGTCELDTVIGHALTRGASVRLIGDDQQLASISAGGVLRDLHAEHGATTLVEVVRFADRAEAAATLALRDGDPAALGYLLDHDRVHVGAEATAADLAYARWRADQDTGRDSVLLAPTNDIVAALNNRARHERLIAAGSGADASGADEREVLLADGLRASIGDLVCSRKNVRQLSLSGSDYVRNGYRWIVDTITVAGDITVRHQLSGRRITLPADYVSAHLTLGYATTIDSAQGITADTCHVVGADTLTRQALYVALTRGRHRNDIYLSTAETDPHRVLTPKATHPDTAVDVLTRALHRDATPVSATTAQRQAHDPFARLQRATDRYVHAVGEAAIHELGPAAMAAIDRAADATIAGLTGQAAWPVLRAHLAILQIAGDDPLQRLRAAADSDLHDAVDQAAVLDWRLDHTGTGRAGGPLRWTPHIPAPLQQQPRWAVLSRRHDRVVELANAVRAAAATWTEATAPRWARPLLPGHPRLIAEIAVFRAATGVPDADTRIAGPPQYPVRTRAVQQLLQRQTAAVLGRPDRDGNRFDALLDGIDPRIRRDPYYPQLAAHLRVAARTGANIQTLLHTAADRGPLPDELPAAALWWRLAPTLVPATIDSPHSGLRPPWITDLDAVLGSVLASTITADPAWPGLVAAVNAADLDRWSPAILLAVAAEQLRDTDAEHPLRPDQYALLLTYAVDLLTSDHPFPDGRFEQTEPPTTPDDDEQLTAQYPDPQRPAPEDDLPFRPPEIDLTPPDPADRTYSDDLDGVDFDDLPRQRPSSYPLTSALADVHDLRRQLQRLDIEIARLQPAVQRLFGPALQAAMPTIRDLRARADHDRPFRIAVELVLAQWADADQRDTDTLRDISSAATHLGRAQVDGDELDTIAAAVQLDLMRTQLPDRVPAEQFHDAFTAALAARADAAGGGEHIVTDDDVDAVISAAHNTDQQSLRRLQTRRTRLLRDLTATEAAAAQAFAIAETRSAEHVLERLDALRTELKALENAGGLHLGTPLVLPPTATDHLPALTAAALRRLVAYPYTLIPVHAHGDENTQQALHTLYAAASANDRQVLWCSPTPERTAWAQAGEIADTVTDLEDAHTRLATHNWRLPAGSLVVVDDATHAPPAQIADLAAHAAAAQAQLILLDTPDNHRLAGPSAPLLSLLQHDLPWSLTLSAAESSTARHRTRPDLDPVLEQARRLNEALLTTDLDDALRRRTELREQHQSSHRVHTALWRTAERTVEDRRREDPGRTR